MFSILKKARIPPFLHRKSNHIFTVWQHIILLALRQYEDKSYRMFVEWLVEAYHLREFLQLSNIPHYTTLQKFASRINSTLLVKIISSFILLLKNINNRLLFVGIDASGFKLTNSSQHYTDRAKLRKKYLKLSLAADIVCQIICTIKIRRYPRNDTIDFQPLITKTCKIIPISITVADKVTTVRIIIF